MLLKSKLTDLEKNKPKQFSFAMKKKMLLGKSKTQFDIVLTVILSIVSLGLTILNIIVETLLDKFLISKNKALWQTFLTDTYFAQREAKEDLCHSVRQINAVMFQVYDINEFRQVYEFYSSYHYMKAYNIQVEQGSKMNNYPFLIH